MNLDYDRIINLFDSNIGPLTIELDKTDLSDFFEQISATDRSQCEYFMRTELDVIPAEHTSKLVGGMYWGSDGIEDFTIGPNVKFCEDAVFKDSDLKRLVVDSPLDGTFYFDGILSGVKHLEEISFTENAVAGLTKMGTTTNSDFTAGQNWKIKVPDSLFKKINSGQCDFNTNDTFDDYFRAHRIK